jgi:hypothetical protein
MIYGSGYRFFIALVPNWGKTFSTGISGADMTEPPSVRAPQVRSGRALYAISVAAQLAGTGQQNIRLYETRGLLRPARTSGGTRQYSDADIAVLLHIGELLEEGLNLAGIAKVLELEAANAKLRRALKRDRALREH